jgi:hypothetical protein
MPIVRRRWILLILALVAIASAVALYVVRRHRPPRAAEMLPDSANGLVFVNVELLRAAGVFQRNHPLQRDPDFDQFVRETGFDFERDLDEFAVAVHNPQNFGHGDDYPRFSEIFDGRIDEKRGEAYLRKLAAGSEPYRGVTIYSIPHEGRTVRAAILDDHTAAASNTETPDAIHAMIDAWRGDRPEPALLAGFYRQIPIGSIAWFVGRVAPPLPQTGTGLVTPSWLHDIAAGSTVVASLRFITQLELRAVADAPSEDDARRIAQNANSWLAVFRALLQNTQTSGTDPDVKAAFDSIQLDQEPRRVVLRADIPAAVLKKIAAEPPAIAPPEQREPAPKTLPKK